MANLNYAGVLNTFSIAGGSQLEFLQNATLSITDVHEEGAPASRFGGNAQGVKRRGRLTVNLFSDSSTDIRVSHLGLSAATLGAVNLLSPNILSRVGLQIQFEHKMNAGAGQLWEAPLVVDGRFNASLDLAMESGTVPQILVDMFSATYGDLNKVLDFTVSGTQVTVPFRMGEAEIPVEKDGLMRYALQLADRSARAGVTLAPAGTTTLLQKAFNAPKTAVAFAFTPAAADNIAISGNMVFESFDLTIEDGKLVPSAITFLTTGTVSGVDN